MARGSRPSPTLRQAPGPALGAPPGRGQGREGNAHRWPNTTAETRWGGLASCFKAPSAPALGTLHGRHQAGRRYLGTSQRPTREKAASALDPPVGCLVRGGRPEGGKCLSRHKGSGGGRMPDRPSRWASVPSQPPCRAAGSAGRGHPSREGEREREREREREPQPLGFTMGREPPRGAANASQH